MDADFYFLPGTRIDSVPSVRKQGQVYLLHYKSTCGFVIEYLDEFDDVFVGGK